VQNHTKFWENYVCSLRHLAMNCYGVLQGSYGYSARVPENALRYSNRVGVGCGRQRIFTILKCDGRLHRISLCQCWMLNLNIVAAWKLFGMMKSAWDMHSSPTRFWRLWLVTGSPWSSYHLRWVDNIGVDLFPLLEDMQYIFSLPLPLFSSALPLPPHKSMPSEIQLGCLDDCCKLP